MNLAEIRLSFEAPCPHCDAEGVVATSRDPDTARDAPCPSCAAYGEVRGEVELDTFGFAKRIRTHLGSCEVEMDDGLYTVQWSEHRHDSIGDAIAGALRGKWSPHTRGVEGV